MNKPLHYLYVTPVLYDPFGVDVPLNLDITHSPSTCLCNWQWLISALVALSDRTSLLPYIAV